MFGKKFDDNLYQAARKSSWVILSAVTFATIAVSLVIAAIVVAPAVTLPVLVLLTGARVLYAGIKGR